MGVLGGHFSQRGRHGDRGLRVALTGQPAWTSATLPHRGDLLGPAPETGDGWVTARMSAALSAACASIPRLSTLPGGHRGPFPTSHPGYRPTFRFARWLGCPDGQDSDSCRGCASPRVRWPRDWLLRPGCTPRLSAVVHGSSALHLPFCCFTVVSCCYVGLYRSLGRGHPPPRPAPGKGVRSGF